MKLRKFFKSKRRRLAAIVVLAVLIVVLLPRYANREDLLNNVPAATACSKDSDCVLTTAGACDARCPNAVNKNFKAILEGMEPSQSEIDRCRTGGACVFRSVGFVAACKNGKCFPDYAPETFQPQVP